MFIGVGPIWAMAVVTPGPNFFVTARTAMAGVRRSAFFVVLGICTGTIIWATAGFSGLSYLFSVSPTFYKIVRYAGGLYISFLGINFIRKAFKSYARADLSGQPASSIVAGWWLGLLTILSNPKTVIFMSSLFITALPPETSAKAGALSILLMFVISLVWYSLVMMAFSSAKIVKTYRVLNRWLNAIAGSVFIGFAIKLLLDNA